MASVTYAAAPTRTSVRAMTVATQPMAAIAAGLLFQLALTLSADASNHATAPACILILEGLYSLAMTLASGSPWFALAMSAVASTYNVLFLGLGFHLATPTGSALFVCVESKTVLLLTALPGAFTLLSRSPPPKHLRVAIRALVILAVVAILQLMRTHAAGVAGLGNLRNFVVPPAALIVLASALVAQDDEYVPFLQHVITFVAVSFGVASLFEVVLGSSLWSSLVSVSALHATKGASAGVADILGAPIVRFGSIYVDPVNASYPLSALSVYYLYRKEKLKSLVFAVIALGTLGKGGLLILIATGIYLAAQGATGARFIGRLRPLPVGVGVVAALYAYLALSHISLLSLVLHSSSYTGGGSSAAVHVAGLVDGLRHAITNPLGAGTGVGGNFANLSGALQNRAQWLGSGAESGIGTLAFQLGMAGLLAYFVGVYLILKSLRTSSGLETRTRNLVFCVLIGWAAGTAFQENGLGPQAVVILVMVASAMVMRSRVGGPLVPRA